METHTSILGISGLFLLAALAILIGTVRNMRASRSPVRGIRRDPATIEMPCSVCHHQLIFHAAEVVPLAPAEMALVVREAPKLVRHRLAEYVCPYCDAAHCFTVDKGKPEWAGVNFYEPQVTGGLCQECRKTLRTPPWAKGQFDGNIDAAPERQRDFGLICSRCHAVCCAECCEKQSAISTDDRTLGQLQGAAPACPRCGRNSMERFYHR